MSLAGVSSCLFSRLARCQLEVTKGLWHPPRHKAYFPNFQMQAPCIANKPNWKNDNLQGTGMNHCCKELKLFERDHPPFLRTDFLSPLTKVSAVENISFATPPTLTGNQIATVQLLLQFSHSKCPHLLEHYSPVFRLPLRHLSGVEEPKPKSSCHCSRCKVPVHAGEKHSNSLYHNGHAMLIVTGQSRHHTPQ